MDPNTLSMEQGKEFLRQCGIPQRDIDMMTEKWVVIASVEVLLRFPLQPGEDPGARCVSNKKCQPSVDRPCKVTERHRGQEKGKSNNNLMSKTEQKSKVVTHTSGHYTHQRLQRAAEVKSPKKPRRAPVGLRAPPAEETARMVKCKNCGAFGHTASSTRCPMKCWDETLAFQPLGSNKEKENLKPRKPQPLRPQHCLATRTEKDPRQRQEEQERKPLSKRSSEEVQRSWKEPTGPCAFIRKPVRPLPVQAPKRRCVPGLVLTDLPFFCPTPSVNKRPRMRTGGPAQVWQVPSCPHPAAQKFSQDSTLCSKPPASSCSDSSRDVAQPAVRTVAQSRVSNLQPRSKRPDVGSKPSSQLARSVAKAPGSESRHLCGPDRTQPKKVKPGSLPSPQVPGHGDIQAPPRKSGFGPKPAPKGTTKTPSVALQSLPFSPRLSPAQDRAAFQPLPPSHVQGRPCGRGSRRWDEGQDSSRLRMAPTCAPPGLCTPAAPEDSEGLGPRVPQSVLYEDLLVSSSSEDSEAE